MFASTGQPANSQFCLVYDKATGEVVHVHEFVSDDPKGSCSRETLEKQALELAPTKYERASLAVFHPDRGQRFSHNDIYRIDRQKNALIVTPRRAQERKGPA